MAMFEVEVRRVQRLTPHLVRITFGAESLRDFRVDGPDQRFKLLLPRPGQSALLLPMEGDWYQSWRQMPTATRPVMRTYTIRAARPGLAEVDVDFVLHGSPGPAARWAGAAAPGDRVALYGAWAEYEVGPSVRWQLILGDHTALPAIGAILERMPSDALAEVLVEVDGPAERLELRAPAGVSVGWLSSTPGRPGQALVRAVQALPPESSWDYAWLAADRDTVGVVRRHLVDDRGLRPTDIMFMGYWRTDGAIDE